MSSHNFEDSVPKNSAFVNVFAAFFRICTALSIRVVAVLPLQFQKRLRLIEARRLMLDEGFSASSAAFEVGYESVSQFTREYGRLFQAPPKRDALRARSGAVSGKERERRRAAAGAG